MRILVLYHNKEQAKFIQKGLSYESIGSECCEIPIDKKVPIKHLSADAFLILSKNPSTTIELVANIRNDKMRAPIIILAENPQERFDFKARQAGADLIFARPFSFSEMSVQMKYLVYLSKVPIQNKDLMAGSLRLDISKRLLSKDGKLIPLRNKEFSLLEFLMLNKSRVLSRTEIFENVWDRNDNISTNTVDVHISSLRKKIDNHSEDGFIKTINCIGYFFDPK